MLSNWTKIAALTSAALFALAGAVDTAWAQSIALANPEFNGPIQGVPDGWTVSHWGAPDSGYLVEVTDEAPYDSPLNVRLAWSGIGPTPDRSFVSLSQRVDAVPLRGRRVRFRAVARTSVTTDAHVGLWMRVDRISGSRGFFDNMADRSIRGADWAVYEVTGDVASDAAALNIGLLVSGAGEAFFDSASLEIIGDAAPDPESLASTNPDEVAEWLSRSAHPLLSTEMGAARSDLAAFSEMVGNARIVSLGEATHGTREHFQIKGRLVEHLVESEGFTAFAIEASYADTLAVNRYVLTGEGDLNSVVAGMGFWTWTTEEVAQLVQWIRDYNLRAPEERQVRFYGFDSQPLLSPLRVVSTFLHRVGVVMPDEDRALIEQLLNGEVRIPRQADIQRDPTQDQYLGDLAARLIDAFDLHREQIVAATSASDFATYRQAAVAMGQAVEIRQSGGGATRDRIMADNVDWILEQEGADGRIILWAHNGHVMHTDHDGALPMGSVLEARHGDDHLTVGFIFGSGGFQAVGPREPSDPHRLQPFFVNLEPDSLDAMFARVDLPFYYVDLRAAEQDAPTVWDWLNGIHRTRWVGSGFFPQAAASLQPIRIAETFDIVIMTRVTTPARPLQPSER